jgi:HlyD family secretion protein
MKRKRLIVGLGAALLIAGACAIIGSRVLPNPAQAQGQTQVEMGTVTRTTLATVVESTGSVLAESDVALSFDTAGTLAQVNVTVGDRVKQGDVLAQLDTTYLQLAVAKAEQALAQQEAMYRQTVQPSQTSIASAQAKVNSAAAAYTAAKQEYDQRTNKVTTQCAEYTATKNTLDRAQTAYDRLANDHQAKNYLSGDWGPFQAVVDGLADARDAYAVALANCNVAKADINNGAVQVTLAQWSQAKAGLSNLTAPRAENVAVAQAQVEQKRLALEQAQLDLQNATLVAPFDGVITEVNVKVGAVSGSGIAIELADVRQYHIDVLIDETEIAGVQVGQSAVATFDALPEVQVAGQVARIDLAGTISQGVVNYKVRIDLEPTTAALRLDMTASIRIQGEEHADVLAVPAAAVKADDQGSYVWVAEGGQSRRVAVQTGLTLDDLTEVQGDLQAGQEIYIGEPAR